MNGPRRAPELSSAWVRAISSRIQIAPVAYVPALGGEAIAGDEIVGLQRQRLAEILDRLRQPAALGADAGQIDISFRVARMAAMARLKALIASGIRRNSIKAKPEIGVEHRLLRLQVAGDGEQCQGFGVAPGRMGVHAMGAQILGREGAALHRRCPGGDGAVGVAGGIERAAQRHRRLAIAGLGGDGAAQLGDGLRPVPRRPRPSKAAAWPGPGRGRGGRLRRPVPPRRRR